jgi:hypothetical protein
MANKWLIAAEATLAEHFPSQDRAKTAKTAKSRSEGGTEGTFGANGTFGTPQETNENADRLPEEKPENAFFCAKSANGAETPQPPASPERQAWTDDEDERAAIVEEGAGCPRAWAEALARLDATRPPGDVPVARWRAFIDDAARFIDGGWCARAVALGWTPLDLFGCDRHKPLARVDHASLVWLLNGRELSALSESVAIIGAANNRQSYRRRAITSGDICLAWELA